MVTSGLPIMRREQEGPSGALIMIYAVLFLELRVGASCMAVFSL